MRAFRLTGWKQEPELMDIPEPEPGPGEVVVKVGAAGACHSDLHMMHELEGAPWKMPFTLGHEVAGWVHALGPGTERTGVSEGQPVAVYGAYSCGSCARCRVGLDNYCENPAGAPTPGGGLGLGMDGGMAEYVLVPDARYLVPLPDGLDPVTAAPLTDAGLTPYHAINRSRHKLGPTSTVAIIGVGGLGHMAIQILKATTAAKVVAVDTRPEALQLAKQHGADVTVEAGDQAVAEIKGATPGGRGADLVLDFVGSEVTLKTAASATRTLGDLTLVGIAGGTLPFGFFNIPYEASVQTVYWGSRSELVNVLDLGARGLLQPTITTFPLAKARDAYRGMEDGTLTGRAVVIPNET
jgi:propanol-preferring alcohol dehydrogenase